MNEYIILLAKEITQNFRIVLPSSKLVFWALINFTKYFAPCFYIYSFSEPFFLKAFIVNINDVVNF